MIAGAVELIRAQRKYMLRSTTVLLWNDDPRLARPTNEDVGLAVEELRWSASLSKRCDRDSQAVPFKRCGASLREGAKLPFRPKRAAVFVGSQTQVALADIELAQVSY